MDLEVIWVMSAIDIRPFHELDAFALLTCQSYNLGNETDWFGSFRGGLYGFYARFHGLTEHFRLLHEWIPPRLRIREDTEYHLASVFFNMDSAVECLTFALNALGFAAQPNGFRDVTDRQSLYGITPKDILGNPAANPPREPLEGYFQIFPTLQSYWAENRQLLSRIIELHDVSKHRETIYTGGQLHLDSPPGFSNALKALGVGDDNERKILYHPHKEILLKDKPKIPRAERMPVAREDFDTLEELVPNFQGFLQNSGELALNDSRSNISIVSVQP